MEAYAKLVGRVGTESEDDASKREFLVKALPCYLGRALSKESGCIVVDSTDTLLSRQHVQIAWTPKNGWKLVCLSKNGCTVDKKRYEKDGTAPLFNGSAIRIGNARLYFTLPVIDEVSVPSSKKRDRAGNAVTDGDDDDDDDSHASGEILMCLTGEEKTAKSGIKLANVHSTVGRLKGIYLSTQKNAFLRCRYSSF